ncbi:ArdC-like ssDNA-binding domain-containing protein [Williamsia herbipolensis]|uniref:ArdC-like ssDNA-binding domain-containing protein n=1 Tax=Williamsia herbipolensis TaxID=1603258 RepID=UPI0005F7C3BE|nr:ArdC-like ssDNA-binding domain-containing protein [Williamsia herbipolensis]
MGTRNAGADKVAERTERAAAMQATIATQVETMAESDGWRAFLDYIGAFHSYSLNNTLLIMSQRPTATEVAGFRKWQELGRQVRKGEKAIRIFGFSSKKVTETDPATGDETETRIPRFPILSVFAKDQTDPIEGAEPTATPDGIATRLAGDDPTGIYHRVEQVITDQGWTVTREQIPGESNGYTTTDGSHRIVVDADVEPAQAAKTLIHEAAHSLLHAADGIDRAEMHRGTVEVEAESVAYVLAGLLGLDTTTYSIGYITGWAEGNAELVTATAARVLGCVHTLADALDQLDEETAAA